MDSKGVSCVSSGIGDRRGERHMVADLLITLVMVCVAKLINL